MQNPAEIFIYDRDLASPTLVTKLTRRAGLELRHSSQLHGGFWECEIAFQADVHEFWQWFFERIRYRLVIEWAPGEMAFEGRVEDVSFEGGAGRVHIRAYGYWSAFTDRIPALSSDVTYSAHGLDAIIQDIRDTYLNSGIISSSNAEIDSPGVSINVTYGIDRMLNAWQCLTDEQQGAANYTDGSGNPWYVAVWEDRVVHFKARDISAVTWNVRLADLQSPPSIRAPYRQIANAVIATYDNAGTETRGTLDEDTDSQDRHGRRDLAVRNTGDNAATANNRASRALTDRKDRRAEVTGGITVNRLYDANGREHSLCELRAGDVLRIRDLIPSSAPSTVNLDAFRTFYVRKVECVHGADGRAVRAIVYADMGDLSLPRLLSGIVRRPLV